MAIQYEPSVIKSISSLEEAHNSAVTNSAFETFLQKFRILAGKFHLQDQLGVTLVHRHTTVEQGKRLMDFGQTLQPFPLADDAHELHGYSIRYKSLVLRNNEWRPYEFELGADSEIDVSFLALIGDLLKEFGLKDVGLRRYSPRDPEELEITDHGGISVKIPWKSDSIQDDYTTTFWAFPSGGPKVYRCQCTDTGTGVNTNHNHINQP